MTRILTAVFTAAAMAVALIGFAPAPAVATQVLSVPSEYTDLQAAIDAAQPGDTVLVDDGTYVGPFVINKPITVTSSSPTASPLLAGPGLVVSMSLGAGETAEISGFTISGGTAGGVFATGGSPIIRDNLITENEKCGSGPGVYAYFAAATITNNEISHNQVQTGCSATGGGIYLGGTPSAGQSTVADNLIQGNDIGIFLNAAGTPVIERNTIRNNSTYNNGAGITMFNFSDAVIRNNFFSGNTSTNGAGGIGATVPTSSDGPFIVNNTFIENQGADASAIAIRVYGTSQGMIANNIFSSSSTAASLNCIPIYGGTPGVRSNLFDSAGSGAFAAGDCAGSESVDGNLVENTAFDANGWPSVASSAVDGANALLAPADDFFGTARPIDGNGDGLAIADIGAIEIPATPVAPPIANAGNDQTVEAAWPTTSVTLDGTATSDPQGLSLSYEWAGSFLDSTVPGPNPSVQFAGLGTFPVTLTVDNGSLQDQDSTSISIVDTTPPSATAGLVDRGKVRGKQRQYEVGANCQDSFDQSPALSASINGFSVTDGELVHFTRSKRGAGTSYVDGILTVVGKSLSLVVSCEDESGNAGSATTTK